MKKVIILRGIPGSGKSTLGKQIQAEAQKAGGSVAIVSTDQHFYELGGGTYKFDPSQIGQAHSGCFRKFIEALTAGTNLIIVDNTATSGVEVSPYRLGAEAFGYEVEIKRVMADPEVGLERNKHGVPKQFIESMHESLQQPLPPYWQTEEKYKSTTSESGEPAFEREARKYFGMIRLANKFERLIAQEAEPEQEYAPLPVQSAQEVFIHRYSQFKNIVETLNRLVRVGEYIPMDKHLINIIDKD